MKLRTIQTLIVDEIKHKLCGKTFFENGDHGYGFDYRYQKCPHCGEHIIYDEMEHLRRERAGISVNSSTGEIEVSFQAYENLELMGEGQ